MRKVVKKFYFFLNCLKINVEMDKSFWAIFLSALVLAQRYVRGEHWFPFNIGPQEVDRTGWSSSGLRLE